MKKILSLTAVVIFLVAVSNFANAAELKTVDIAVKGMTCGACVGKVESTLKNTEGVKEVTVSFETNSAKVVYDVSKADENTLKAAVANAGFTATNVKEWNQKSKTKTKASATEKAGCCGAGSCGSKS